MATVDLDDVNFALRELVRLQLSGELANDDAWRERQQLLDAVEANWDDVPEQRGAAEPAGAVASVAASAVNRPSQASVSRDCPGLAAAVRLRLGAMHRRLWPRLRELGLVWALLGVTVATWIYMASL